MKQHRGVVITGAAGAMGSVPVDRFLANGDTVVATDRDAALEILRDKVGANTRLVTLAADISKEEDCARLAAARDKAGRVDVLINCVGYFPIVAFEKMTTDQWRQTIDINLTGNFLMTRAMLPLMKGRAWGRIINFGSASVFEGVPVQAHCRSEGGDRWSDAQSRT
jgi:NAD(P)-dependent dehydrogenase (short-subunit alcohol dehydrogenase family)